jgi:hypothetical protein
MFGSNLMEASKLFVFPAESLEQIQIGIQEHTWAVPTSSDSSAEARFLRSQEMPIFSRAVIFCTSEKIFTLPFRARSIPQNRFQSGLWSGTYRFPFAIYPLGDTSKFIDSETAGDNWAFYRNLHIPTALDDFIPSPISSEDWKVILKDLGSVTDNFPEPRMAEPSATATP